MQLLLFLQQYFLKAFFKELFKNNSTGFECFINDAIFIDVQGSDTRNDAIENHRWKTKK